MAAPSCSNHYFVLIDFFKQLEAIERVGISFQERRMHMLLWLCLVMKTHYWTVQNSKKCIWTNETGVNRAGQFMVVDTHSCSYRELHDNSSVLYWETISLDKVYGIAFWFTHYMTAKRFFYKALCYFSKKSRVITLIYSWFIVFTWQVFKFRFEYNVYIYQSTVMC